MRVGVVLRVLSGLYKSLVYRWWSPTTVQFALPAAYNTLNGLHKNKTAPKALLITTT